MAEGDAELQDLYRDVLIDYYRDPACKGELPGADFHAHGVNPLCGDEIRLSVQRSGDGIAQLRYTGHGCVISQASAAMMCEALASRPLAQALDFVGAFKAMMLDGAPAASLPEALSGAEALEGVRKFPLRIKCALLAWNTFLQGLSDGGAGRREAEYREAS